MCLFIVDNEIESLPADCKLKDMMLKIYLKNLTTSFDYK